MAQPARDVFLCHAHHDKAELVFPLAKALRARMVSTWVDEAHIKPGESIFDAVGEGLSRARYVVPVISEAFLDRHWTEEELAAAFSREAGSSGERIVVPVVAVDLDTYRNRFPLLADRFALDLALGAENAATKIAELFGRRADRWHVYMHRRALVGRVWTRVGAVDAGDHRIELVWGSNIISIEQDLEPGQPISLEHGKQRPDQVHLLVRVEPPAFVTFGEGRPPDQENVVELDEGWVRARGWEEAEEALEIGLPSLDAGLPPRCEQAPG